MKLQVSLLAAGITVAAAVAYVQISPDSPQLAAASSITSTAPTASGAALNTTLNSNSAANASVNSATLNTGASSQSHSNGRSVVGNQNATFSPNSGKPQINGGQGGDDGEGGSHRGGFLGGLFSDDD